MYFSLRINLISDHLHHYHSDPNPTTSSLDCSNSLLTDLLAHGAGATSSWRNPSRMYVMPRHPSAPNPLMAPTSFRVNPWFLPRPTRTWCQTPHPSNFISYDPRPCFLCCRRTDLFASPRTHQNMPNNITQFCLWPGLFYSLFPLPAMPASLISSHFLLVSLQMSFIRKAFPNPTL